MIALQIIGYYDELTITNPLMSTRAKKNKIGMHGCRKMTSTRGARGGGGIPFMTQ